MSVTRKTFIDASVPSTSRVGRPGDRTSLKVEVNSSDDGYPGNLAEYITFRAGIIEGGSLRFLKADLKELLDAS